ncbi:hypothetical protein DACRYDRAFT_118938 [Dacryopinax primogenitus]|uniref:Uncharacterized protein n=1 Tax=Dacryopinax primogenitus (strain DJM 731) TaxID=1858805 RepID=M5FSN4_DACPD|nr:uncharacterized protein DACRYDRAFT_118938 [Dacryopinax primogenitus]EJT98219.1 hypothetical protein DACRYDRAFT_118938 [Dacryopinax primogenitus]
MDPQSATPASPTALSSSSSSTNFSSPSHPSQPPTNATTPEPLPQRIIFPSDGRPQHLSQPPPPRRKASIYPLSLAGKQTKPFSRSAAKRESVMMLGSIEHLQHYFTKQGIVAKQRPSKVLSRLVPAIGPADGRRMSNPFDPLTPSSSQSLVDLPPSPVAPPPRPSLVLPALDVRERHDPLLLRPQVLGALEEVEVLWAVDPVSISSLPASSSGVSDAEGEKDAASEGDVLKRDPTDAVDVLHSLLRTTHLIRSVRNYLVSLPSSSNSPPPPAQLSTFRPNNLAPQPVPRGRMSSGSTITSTTSVSAVTGATGSTSTAPAEPSARIRRAALDLLAQLRLFEESCRLGPTPDLMDDDEPDGHDNSSDVSSLGPPRALSPFHGSGGPSRGPSPLPPYDGQDEDEDGEKKREAWDERLVLGGGFLYRQDLTLKDCTLERRAVGLYLATVDQVLFRGPPPGQEGKDGRGWRCPAEADTPQSKRRVSGSHLSGRRPASSPAGKRRVVSAQGLLESSLALGGMLSEEPEEINAAAEGIDRLELGGIAEHDEEVILEEDEDEDDAGDISLLSQDEASLPDWAQTERFTTLAERTHALLAFYLPSALQPRLPLPTPEEDFWLALQSGQLICVAYNAAVRRSSKPWGYIEPRAIHDIIALDLAASQPPPPPVPEAPVLHPLHHALGPQFTGKKGQQQRPEPVEPLRPQMTGSARKEGGWTFRRTENLRLFAAACRLRYLIPFVDVLPPHAKAGKASDAVVFDPKVVAAKAEGWEAMLAVAVEEWVGRVVRERREEGDRGRR